MKQPSLCIRDIWSEGNLSVCGKDVTSLPCYESIGHAVHYLLDGTGLPVCKACAQIVVDRVSGTLGKVTS